MGDLWMLALKNLLFPQFCKQCGMRILTEENAHFCPTCWGLSPRIEPPFCNICGRPHPKGVGLLTVESARIFPCGPCASSNEQRYYGRTVGAAIFDGPIAEAIKLLKFHGRINLVPPLASLLREAATSYLDTEAYEIITPVPLHRVRQRERGFNQSELLARAVLPLFTGARFEPLLYRVRPTRTQSLLENRSERMANVSGAFAIAEKVSSIHTTVLLVDDVVTSHGTVSECARVLRKAGAKRVDVLAVALAIPTR